MSVHPSFLRALALEIDSQAGPAGRDALLRGVGRHLARLHVLPNVASLEALEMEMNGALAGLGWGKVRLALNEAERCVMIMHSGLPTVGSAGEPAGYWLAAALEGLYEGWMAQQPGGDPAFTARRRSDMTGSELLLRFERP
jgi:hypothetical protein